MIATDMTTSGSTEEKLRWAFKMYDKDGSGGQIFHFISTETDFLNLPGKIELREMIDILGTLYELQGFPVVSIMEREFEAES